MISDDVFVQRLFTVALGMVAILGVYRFATLLKNSYVGLICALFMAVSPVAVSTSIVFRNYADDPWRCCRSPLSFRAV